MTCPYCGRPLVEVDNPMRREVRHRRGEEVLCPGPLTDREIAALRFLAAGPNQAPTEHRNVLPGLKARRLVMVDHTAGPMDLWRILPSGRAVLRDADGDGERGD